MSALFAEPPVLEVPRLESPVETSPAAPPALADPVPLRRQVAELLRRAGLAKTDLFIFTAAYVFILLLVAFLCLGARVGHAQAWEWGRHLMNLPLAVAGLGLLMLATIAAFAALRWARSSRRLTVAALALAALGSLGFVATLVLDLDAKWRYGIRPAGQFHPNERYVARRFGMKLPRNLPPAPSVAAVSSAAPVVRAVDAVNGRRFFLGTCISCHGPRGEGLPGQGKSLIANEFVGRLDDTKLLDFLRVGRQPWDALNTTKVQMPPRGGNPMLTDDDLRDVAAFVRTLQTATPSASQSPGATTNDPAAAAVAGTEPLDPALLAPRWIVSPPPSGPPGLSPEYLAELNRPYWKPPRDGVAFVDVYYLATQFSGLYASGVALMFGVFFAQALRGRFTAERRAPLALGVAGCAGLMFFWSLLFPFVYVF